MDVSTDPRCSKQVLGKRECCRKRGIFEICHDCVKEEYFKNDKRGYMPRLIYVGVHGFEPQTLPPHSHFLKNAAWRDTLNS